MGIGETVKKHWKPAGVFLAGAVCGLIGTGLAYRDGCNLAVGGERWASWSCAPKPCEGRRVSIDLADRSTISLAGALQYVRDATQSQSGAQIFVDADVLEAPFAQK